MVTLRPYRIVLLNVALILLGAVTFGCSGVSVTDPGDPFADVRFQTYQRINQLRATLSLPPLAAWSSKQDCLDGQAKADFNSGTAHSAFGHCGESAQNECPGWSSTTQIPTGCLQLMWDEGPGTPYSAHGHYINMTNPAYHKVAVGFYVSPSHVVWAVMDFAP